MPYIPRAICGTCNQVMVILKNGNMLEALAPSLDRNNKEQFRPYYMVAADSYQCPTCGMIVYVGFGQNAVESYDIRYDKLKPDVQFHFSDYVPTLGELDEITKRFWQMIAKIHIKSEQALLKENNKGGD
jgi:hypothetical protein